MNQVVLIGRLASELELQYTPNSQTAVCRFTLAVNRMRREDPADFIRITVWGKMAENCNQYLAKGRQVGISGRIQTGSYTNKNNEKVYTTEVVAQNVEFLGSNGSSSTNDNAPAPQTQAQQQNPAPQQEPSYKQQSFAGFAATEDDIPF